MNAYRDGAPWHPSREHVCRRSGDAVLDLSITTGVPRGLLLVLGVVALRILVRSAPRESNRTHSAVRAVARSTACSAVTPSAAVNPFDVLTTRTFSGTAGLLVAGRDDRSYRPEAQIVLAATRAAGMTITSLELPGPHSWQVWGPGLQKPLPWSATRTGLSR